MAGGGMINAFRRESHMPKVGEGVTADMSRHLLSQDEHVKTKFVSRRTLSGRDLGLRGFWMSFIVYR
eukprot:361119-Pyramimonas_sp.AAC.1